MRKVYRTGAKVKVLWDSGVEELITVTEDKAKPAIVGINEAKEIRWFTPNQITQEVS